MKFNKADLKVGQKLWFSRTVNRTRIGDGDDYEVQITKLGNKWISYRKLYDGELLGCFGEERADYNGFVDGGKYGSPGELWESEAVWQADQDRHAAWKKLRLAVDRRAPDGLTVEQIEAAYKALFGHDGN